MRVRRIIRPAFYAVLAAFILAGCSAGRAISPRPEHAGAVYRNFLWPVSGTVASGFGGRGGRHHNGIDILAAEGTPVRAAETGVVTYAGSGLRGFGNAAVLDHGGGSTSLYGHLREIQVKSGDVVSAGSVIGTVGRTGNATTSHLHFELVVDGRSVDPADYLQGAEGTR
jgi:murein DD-endopeptidase MepM/ murein hydrolase activator NlpD